MKPCLCFSVHISEHLSNRKTFRTEAVEIIETLIAHTVQLVRNLFFTVPTHPLHYTLKR